MTDRETVTRYPLLERQISDLVNRFTYHTPNPNQPERYNTLRDAAKELATLILQCCPDSREQSLAITKLEEALFWANAGIARNE
jgi:carbonic anhydrase